MHTGDIEKSETIAKGATEKILQLCDRYYDENGSVKPLTEAIEESIHEKSRSLARDGLRVLAFAKTIRNLTKRQQNPQIWCFAV